MDHRLIFLRLLNTRRSNSNNEVDPQSSGAGDVHVLSWALGADAFGKDATYRQDRAHAYAFKPAGECG